jgi:hypothetical protein
MSVSKVQGRRRARQRVSPFSPILARRLYTKGNTAILYCSAIKNAYSVCHCAGEQFLSADRRGAA